MWGVFLGGVAVVRETESRPERYARLDARIKELRRIYENSGAIAPSAPGMYFPTAFIKGEAHWMDPR